MDTIKVVNYVTTVGKEPFTDWLHDLDVSTRAVIRTKIARVRLGNYGDCKPVKGGAGIWELRIFYGPGYRVYFGRIGKELVLFLLGGDKGSQNRDIVKAKKYWLSYKESLDG